MDVDAMTQYAAAGLAAAANPDKAAPMAAYMKTDQPFHGVQKPARTGIFREMVGRFAPDTRKEYQSGVLCGAGPTARSSTSPSGTPGPSRASSP